MQIVPGKQHRETKGACHEDWVVSLVALSLQMWGKYSSLEFSAHFDVRVKFRYPEVCNDAVASLDLSAQRDSFPR